jgi:ribosomal protein L18E
VQFLNDVKQKATVFAEANAAALLTAGGVVGTVATAILTGRAGFKAHEILQTLEMEAKLKANSFENDGGTEVVSPTTFEKFVAVGPQFIPPVIVGGATIASIVMANRVSAQKAAALAAAYGLAERNLSEYKEKISEKLTGPKKQQLEEELSQDRVNRTDGYQNIVIVEGEVLCFDEPTGRYFRSTMEKIRKAVNTTNAEILHSGWANATFFYHELGLTATSWTDDMGWNTDQLLDLKYDTVRSPDDRPCLSIDFTVLPKPDYVPKHF